MLYTIILYVALFLLAVFCYLYWRWLKVRNYWAERDVPHLKPNPIVGSLTFLQKVNAAVWMRQMYERFKTPYIGIWLFWRPALIVNSPDIARRILVKDSAIFRDRFLSGGDNDPVGKYNLFTIKDPEWTDIRRRLTSTFTAARLRILQDFTRSKSKELVQRIQQDPKSGNDLKNLFVDYTTDVIGTSAFGVACNTTLTGEGPLRKVTKDFMKFSILRGIGWCCLFFFPELVDVFRFKFFPKSSTDYFAKIFKAAVAQRTVNGVGDHKDLLDALLQIKKESDEKNLGYSEEFIIAQGAIFVSAGYDASAGLLTFTIYELAYNIEIQDKLIAELQEAKDKNGCDNFTIDQLAELTYLNCILKEGLRKYSPMSWLDRVAAKDYEIDGKLTIKAGTPVYVNGSGMHYDPLFFPDPTKFDPDRFLPDNERNIAPYTYIPFGEGPRVCIGQRFGLMTTRYAMVAIFLNYKVRPIPGKPIPTEVAIDSGGIFFNPGETMSLRFIPINST